MQLSKRQRPVWSALLSLLLAAVFCMSAAIGSSAKTPVTFSNSKTNGYVYYQRSGTSLTLSYHGQVNNRYCDLEVLYPFYENTIGSTNRFVSFGPLALEKRQPVFAYLMACSKLVREGTIKTVFIQEPKQEDTFQFVADNDGTVIKCRISSWSSTDGDSTNVVEFTYDAKGRLTDVTRANNIPAVHVSYNDNGTIASALIEQDDTETGSNYDYYTYKYDENLLVTGINTHAGFLETDSTDLSVTSAPLSSATVSYDEKHRPVKIIGLNSDCGKYGVINLRFNYNDTDQVVDITCLNPDDSVALYSVTY